MGTQHIHASLWQLSCSDAILARASFEKGGKLRQTLASSYAAAAVLTALYGLQAIALLLLYLRHRKEHIQPPEVKEYPAVTVQLPIYNERYVVPRLLRAVARLRYPRDLLEVQILDDSDDQTHTIVEWYARKYRGKGLSVQVVHRTERRGYKAGALAHGLRSASGDLVAVFDADFVPPEDWLLRTVPYFVGDPSLGFLQTRWGHLNPDYSRLTGAQRLALDGHFVVEQVARSRSGLMMNFNGTAGIWRKSCILQSGGWSAETLSEDMDLSFRAQIRGWKGMYLPDAVVPAELPPQLAAFKRQQFRWARGSTQVLRSLSGEILRSALPWWAKAESLMHLAGYMVSPLMLLLLVLLLPIVWMSVRVPWPLAYVSLAGLGPVLLCGVAQRAAAPKEWWRRMLDFPFLAMLGIGISWSNTLAIMSGLFGRDNDFLRTPKFSVRKTGEQWQGKAYALRLARTFWGEMTLAGYAALTIAIALARGDPYVVPFLGLYLVGFLYTAGLELWQHFQMKSASSWQEPFKARVRTDFRQ